MEIRSPITHIPHKSNTDSGSTIMIIMNESNMFGGSEVLSVTGTDDILLECDGSDVRSIRTATDEQMDNLKYIIIC